VAVAAAAAATLLVACGSGAAAPAPKVATTSAQASAPGDHTIRVAVQGRVRTLILHVPRRRVARRPLVLVYHGALDTAGGTEQSTDFQAVSDRTGALVAYLQGYADTWNEGAGHTPAERAHVNDVAFTTAAIARLERLVAFDRARIVATGFSNGALMVEDLGCHLANELALIVPVEGELPVTVAARCRPSRPLTVYEIDATGDAAIPYGGGPFAGVGGGTTVLSAPRSAAVWAARDGCARRATTTAPRPSIRLATYTACRHGVTVTLRTIVGGSHEWGTEVGRLVAEHVPAG
jgi:polyhydroxybutyrate depolymerase